MWFIIGFDCKLFLLVSILFTHKVSGFELKLKPSTERVTKPLGSSLVLTCEVFATTSTDIRIQWFDQNKKEILETAPQSRVYTEKDGARIKKLYVTSIEGKDAGKYSCVANIERSRQERSLELALFKDITFDHAPLKQYQAIYQDVTIECRVSGQPVPDVSWRYNGVPISTGGKYIVEKKGLRIKNITRNDDGIYSCRAEVEADGRYDDRKITVAVHIPPKMTKSFGNTNGTEGDRVVLSCAADGLPSPEFRFFKDNKPLAASDQVFINEQAGHVTFISLRKQDEGQYQCRAINDVGNDTHRGHLKVFVPPKIHELKNVTKSENDAAILLCKCHGDPSPNMHFKKEGSSEEFKLGNNDGDRIVVTQRSSGHLELHIKRLLASDRSSYVCVSRNNAGRDEAHAFIDVLYKPRFLKEQGRVAHGWAGHVDNVSCLVDANPPPLVQWIRYDRVLENNETYRIFEGRNSSNLQVRIKEVDQSWIYGEYVCRAKNSKGEISIKIHLNRTTVPDKPARAFTRTNTPNHVVISVEPPFENGGIPITGYRVEYEGNIQEFSISDHDNLRHPLTYQPTDRRMHKNTSTISQFDEITLENLKPSTRYNLRIRAKNEVGVGSPLDFAITTADRTKPFPIVIISPAEGALAYQYKLQWEKPKTGGWPIQSYEIKYRKANLNDISDTTDNDWKVLQINDDTTKPAVEYTLTGLQPLTEYEVVIRARNQAGTSEHHEPFLLRTSEVRMGPSSLANGMLLSLPTAFFQLLLTQANIVFLGRLFDTLVAW